MSNKVVIALYEDKLTPEVISEVARRFSQRSFEDMSFEDMSQELHQLIDDVLDDMKSDHIISGKNTPCHEIGKLEDGSPDPCYDCAVIDDKGICQQCIDYNKYVKKGRALPVIQNLCACVDTNARLCFEKRYPDRKLDDIYEPYEKCGCPCHTQEDVEDD